MVFPSSTVLNKKISKQRIYENISIPNETKKLFVDQIKAIYWQNKFSTETINLSSDGTVTEIEIIRIVLNRKMIDESVLKLLDNGIPYHIIFVLEYNEQIKICAAYKDISPGGILKITSKYFYTEWASKENTKLKINGLTLDTVYEEFIRQIAGGNLQEVTGNIREDITKCEAKKKLKKEIERLEKKARAEKQPKKKFELATEVKKLKKKLEKLTEKGK